MICTLCGAKNAPRSAFDGGLTALCNECYKLWQDFKLPDLTITKEDNNK